MIIMIMMIIMFLEKSSKADDGLYECQVNTEPKINYKIFLSVSGMLESTQSSTLM